MSNKFPASVVKGTGFTLSRAENQPFYVISANSTKPNAPAASPYMGFVYKNADDGQYTVTLGLERTTVADFNTVKSYIKSKLAA
jgi:hypothetical protein